MPYPINPATPQKSDNQQIKALLNNKLQKKINIHGFF